MNTNSNARPTCAVLCVVFRFILGYRHALVPLDEAWAFWTANAGHLDTHFGAFVSHPGVDEGRPFYTFAQAKLTWDFTSETELLARIGLGAGGDGGPTNPALRGTTRPQMHLTAAGDWATGINWEGSAEQARSMARWTRVE